MRETPARKRCKERGAVAAEFIFVFPILLMFAAKGTELIIATTRKIDMQNAVSGMARQLAFMKSVGADESEMDAKLAPLRIEGCTATYDASSGYAVLVEFACPYPTGGFFELHDDGTKRVMKVSSTWPALEHFATPKDLEIP